MVGNFHIQGIASINIGRFKKWLIQNGAEMLPITNEYELIRFRGDQTGIIYKSGKVGNKYTRTAIKCFREGVKWSGAPISTGRINSYRSQKKMILKRDGDLCFYCWNKLGEDISLEHLYDLKKGGKNTLDNMVLAHEECNKNVEQLDMIEKIKKSMEEKIKK